MPMQEFQARESSNIGWARYFPEELRLEIDFRNQITGVRSSTYEYQNFSSADWEDFRSAESKGKHFASKIRAAKSENGETKYPFQKVIR